MWGTRGALSKIEARIEVLEKDLKTQERLPKLLKLEWEETLDKMLKVMARLNARIRASEKAEDKLEELPAGVDPPEDSIAVGQHARMAKFRTRLGR